MSEKKIGPACLWLEDEGTSYSTDCGNYFYFDDSGAPEEHGFRFCPYCGRELIDDSEFDDPAGAP